MQVSYGKLPAEVFQTTLHTSQVLSCDLLSLDWVLFLKRIDDSDENFLSFIYKKGIENMRSFIKDRKRFTCGQTLKQGAAQT